VAPLTAITSAASVAGLARLTSEWAEMGSKVQFSAQRAGMSAGKLAALQGAAQLAGSSAESLTSGITSLSDNLTEAAAGRAPEATMAFNYLGVSVNDAAGHVRKATDALPELADKIAAIKNPTIQAKIATMLFGGAAEDLLPTLRLGAAGLAENSEKARHYGALSDRAAAAANDFREKQVELTLAVKGLGNSIASDLDPVLGPLMLQLAEWIKNNKELISSDIAGVVRDSVPVISGFAKEANAVAQALGGWKMVLEGIVAIKLGSWAATAVANMNPLVRLALLTYFGFKGAENTGKSVAAAGENGLTPAMYGPEGINPIMYRDAAGHLYSPEEAAKLSRNRVFPGEGGMDALSQNPSGERPRLGQWWHEHAPTWLGGAPGANSGDPRGIRNNNPLNLSYAPGQGAAATDGRFGIYKTMDEGVAAAERQLLLYQDRDHLRTLREIISKWAPPSENDTESYIRSVSKRAGVASDKEIDLHDPEVAKRVIAGMAKVETGRDISVDSINRGVNVALAPPVNVQGGTGTSAARSAQTEKGSLKVSIRGEGLPPGTRIAAAAEGNIIDGAPKIEHAMPMGAP